MPIDNRMRLDADMSALRPLVNQVLAHTANTTLLTTVLRTFEDLGRFHKGAQPALVVLKNQFVSLFEMRRDEPETYTMQKAKRDLDRAWGKALTAFDEAQPAKPQKRFGDDPPGMGPMGEVSGQAAVKIRKAAESVTRHLAARKGLLVEQVPVFPMVPMRSEILTSKGVPFDSYAGYTVLMKQWVLFLTPGYVKRLMLDDDAFEEDQEGLTPKQRKAQDAALASYYEDIVQTTCAKYRASLVSEHVSHWNEARCYWMAPASQLAQLRASAFGGRFAPTQWSVAFSGAK